MESITDLLAKKDNNSLVYFMKIIDPEFKYKIDNLLRNSWNALELTEQRRLYLYCLYRKWRGDGFYGTPYDIIKNCHPYPTNWNGSKLINRLMKENKMVSAKYDGSYGIFTTEEAFVWQMTDVKPLNF